MIWLAGYIVGYLLTPFLIWKWVTIGEGESLDVDLQLLLMTLAASLVWPLVWFAFCIWLAHTVTRPMCDKFDDWWKKFSTKKLFTVE